jgi:hypothetical protein
MLPMLVYQKPVCAYVMAVVYYQQTILYLEQALNMSLDDACTVFAHAEYIGDGTLEFTGLSEATLDAYILLRDSGYEFMFTKKLNRVSILASYRVNDTINIIQDILAWMHTKGQSGASQSPAETAGQCVYILSDGLRAEIHAHAI